MDKDLIDGIMIGMFILVCIRVFLCDDKLYNDLWNWIDEWCQRKGILK